MLWKLFVIRIPLYLAAIFCSYYVYILFAFLMGYADDADNHTKPLLAWSVIFIILNILIDRLILIKSYSKKEFIWVSEVIIKLASLPLVSVPTLSDTPSISAGISVSDNKACFWLNP